MPTVVTPRNEMAAEILSLATGFLQGAEDRRRRDEDIAIDQGRFDRRMGQDQYQFEESQNRTDARQKSSQDFGREMDGVNYSQEVEREQRTEAILDRRRVSEAKAAQEAIEWEYNFRSQQEMEKLNAATMDVMFDPRLAPEERDYAMKQIEARRRGIQPMPVINKGPKFPEGQGFGEVWKDTASGALITRDKDGTPKLLLKPEERPGLNMKFTDYVEAFEKMSAAMTTEEPTGETDAEGVAITKKVPPKPEDVERSISAMILGYQRLITSQKAADLDADMIGDEIDQASGGGPGGGGGRMRGPGMTAPEQFNSSKLGRAVSMEEIERTAQKRNLSIQQVLMILGIDPRELAGPPAGGG